MTAKQYRRLLMLATVSPLLVGIAAYRLEAGSVWPWVVALPVALGCWVARDARIHQFNPRLWTVLAVLPGALWVTFLVADWVIPA